MVAWLFLIIESGKSKNKKKSYTNEKLSLRTKHFKFPTLSSEKRIKGFNLNVF